MGDSVAVDGCAKAVKGWTFGGELADEMDVNAEAALSAGDSERGLDVEVELDRE